MVIGVYSVRKQEGPTTSGNLKTADDQDADSQAQKLSNHDLCKRLVRSVQDGKDGINHFNKLLATVSTDGTLINLKSEIGYEVLSAVLCMTWGRNNLERLHYFLEQGANPAATGKCGQTILHIATDFRCLEEPIIRDLLEHGDESLVNMRDKAGKTVLHYVARNCDRTRDVDILELLFKYGADLKIQAANGETALHVAIYSRWEVGIEAMLERDVSIINIKTKGEHGYKAIDLAQRFCKPDGEKERFIQIFKKYGGV